MSSPMFATNARLTGTISVISFTFFFSPSKIVPPASMLTSAGVNIPSEAPGLRALSNQRRPFPVRYLSSKDQSLAFSTSRPRVDRRLTPPSEIVVTVADFQQSPRREKLHRSCRFEFVTFQLFFQSTRPFDEFSILGGFFAHVFEFFIYSGNFFSHSVAFDFHSWNRFGVLVQ